MRPIVFGYHGCEEEVASEIISRRTVFRAGTRSHDWLGAGIYFWEDDSRRALEWAASRRDIRKPAVVGAVIDLTGCLNLVQMEAVALVEEAYEHLKKANGAAGQPMPVNCGFDEGARYLDYMVFETLHALREDQGKQPFSSVRAFFPEGGPIFPGAGISRRDHIQICVRDAARIIGCFLPNT